MLQLEGDAAPVYIEGDSLGVLGFCRGSQKVVEPDVLTPSLQMVACPAAHLYIDAQGITSRIYSIIV